MIDSQIPIDINLRAWNVFQAARASFHLLDVIETILPCGAKVFDFGIRRLGTLAGGLVLAQALTADLASINIVHSPLGNLPFWPHVQVVTDSPLLACMASQYAGWQVKVDDFFAIGSGPGRVLRGREPLLLRYQLVGRSSIAVICLESGRMPTDNVAQYLAKEMQLSPEVLTICVAPTSSIPGTVQIVARSVEATLHKLHEMNFDLKRVRLATGIAPLPPISQDDLQAIGWTNDAILFGAHVTLCITGDLASIQTAARALCSETSADFGRPFKEIFEAYQRDFYRIDKMLFAPAQATIFAIDEQTTLTAGQLHHQRLLESFF